MSNQNPRSDFGLALAAGGARGAYQAGALLQLAEQEIKFSAVAGTSIGSLNAAFYAQGDGSVGHIRQLIQLWLSLADAGLIRLHGKALFSAFASVFSIDVATAASVLVKFATGHLTILDPAPVARVLDAWLDYDKICASDIDLTVAVLPEVSPLLDIIIGTSRRAKYLRASEIGAEKLRLALLAAGAIPLAFPSRAIEGRKFSDAGLADPLPAQFLYASGYRRIFSIFLSDTTVQNRSDFPDSTLVQIRPTTVIDTGLNSTFDFSRPTVERLIDLGYRDTYQSCSEATELMNELRRMREAGARIQRLADSLRQTPGQKSFDKGLQIIGEEDDAS